MTADISNRFVWQRSYETKGQAAAFEPRLVCWDSASGAARRTDVSITYTLKPDPRRVGPDGNPVPFDKPTFTPTFELFVDSALVASSTSLDQLRGYGEALARWFADFEL